MSSTPPGQTPAGWYPDSNQPGTLRYWDGAAWTEHTHVQDQPATSGAAPGTGSTPGYESSSGYQSNPGYQTYSPGATAPPNNHLVPAILTTLFCCLPFGIVSIVKASQVNNLWSTGQYDAARKASDDAKKWWIVSLVVALVLFVLYFLAVVVGASAGS